MLQKQKNPSKKEKQYLREALEFLDKHSFERMSDSSEPYGSEEGEFEFEEGESEILYSGDDVSNSSEAPDLVPIEGEEKPKPEDFESDDAGSVS